MEDYKIKVNNEAESKEAQELFFELGFGWHCGDIKYLKRLERPYLYAYAKSKDITCGSTESNFINHENKELKIPQLRDLVVLKRNDGSDATHVSQSGFKWFVSSDNKIHGYLDKKWVFISDDASVLQDLKPIEKEMKEYLEVKEYLNPNNNYSYHKVHAIAKGNDWVEIPSKANFAYFLGFRTLQFTALEMGYRDAVIVWQRHTQPEELPFIGDEPKRENNHYFIDVSDVDEIDFYEIAKRYNVTDPAIQHILKKCLAVGGRGHKDMETDLKDIFKTAKRALKINGVDFG